MSAAHVIVAMGARTPVGLRAETSAAAIRAGISRHASHPTMIDGAGDPLCCAVDATLDPDLRGAARAETLAMSALQECIEPLVPVGKATLSLWMGVPETRPGWGEADTKQLMRRLSSTLGERFNLEQVMSVPRGHASGLAALELALREVDSGRVHGCIVGGVDTYLHHETIDWLDETRQIMTATNRSSFVPGEGAGFFVVMTESMARTLRLTVLATVRAVSTAVEPHPIKTPGICIGEGLTEAIRGATAPLRLPEEKVATTYCDINGERYRNDEFFYVPLRLWAPFVDSNRFEAPADCWGDVGAASGPLLAMLAIASGQRGYARGPHVLLWTSSEGGTRAAATLSLPT
ncbi:MAG: beta-ketoacyl synthase N-terminal-like domain-containing protein [Myxococcota bacterium]